MKENKEIPEPSIYITHKILKEVYPEFAKKLENLKKLNPGEFSSMVRKSHEDILKNKGDKI